MAIATYTAIDVDKELEPWINGKIVGRVTNRYDETTVVTENAEGFSLIRVFPLGLDGTAGVSCDVQDKPISDVLQKLLARL